MPLGENPEEEIGESFDIAPGVAGVRPPEQRFQEETCGRGGSFFNIDCSEEGIVSR